MRILLVEPAFPMPDKSKNHAHSLPIGLLKIGSYHRRNGDYVKLLRGNSRCGFTPDRVLITSSFTYWCNAVHESAGYYHRAYPSALVQIGGVYASLMPAHCRKHSPFAQVKPGLYMNGAAEHVPIDYSILPEELDYQVIHTSRGCPRRCAFCGTWRIEPEFTYKQSILHEIRRPRVVFYDNNLLANPYIDKILTELAGFRLPHGKKVSCESQSGIDLRLLGSRRAALLRRANFAKPRISWDGGYQDWPVVRRAVRELKRVGYGRKDIFIFMLYNHSLSYSEMMKKLDACRRWRVRVIDCRFRPLNAVSDDYRSGPRAQQPGAFYLYPGWTDSQVRRLRSNVRRQNIAILLNLPEGRYIAGCELRKVDVPLSRGHPLLTDE
jgi:hypothetical protein